MSAADRLRGGRSVAARGHLSLDREKARQKLRMFRLPDPHYYVLQFVRAASVLGARQIDFEVTASEMTCSFPVDLPAELLEDIWGVAFEARTDADAQAVNYVALGIGSAQALNPAFVDIHSGNVSLRLQGDDETITARSKGVGTVIHVKEKFRFGHLLEFFQSIAGKLPEVHALESRCGFSGIEVRVNGLAKRPLVGANVMLTRSFTGEFERGFVALETVSLDGWCEMVRDGVSVARVPIPNHGKAAYAAMESTRIRTDLSGLGLIQDEGWDAPIHDVLIPAFHDQILEWLRSLPRHSVFEPLDVLAELSTYADQRDGKLHEASRRLFDDLCKRPIFESALDPPGSLMLSIDDATWPALVRYSTERFADVTLPGERKVLLVEPSSGAGVHNVRVRMLRESAMYALGKSRIRGAINVTKELERKAMLQRNQSLWKARPQTRLGRHKVQRSVRVGSGHGFVFLPLWKPDAALDTEDSGFAIYKDGRLLRRHGKGASIGVEVDGDFRINTRFDDILRGPNFTTLAAQLCGMTLGLHRDFAEALIETGGRERSRPRILDKFVLSLCEGEWCTNFFDMLGYLPVTQVPKVLEDHAKALTHLTWFGQAQRAADVIRELGPIAQVLSIELADGTLCSLADAVNNPDLCLLRPTGNWRAFLAETRKSLNIEVLSNIAIVDDVQERLLRGLCSAPDARVAVERLHARSRYFQLAPYEFEEPPGVVLETTEKGTWFEGKIMLVPGGEQGTCVTTFVWQDRVLGHRRFEVPLGSFKAVVWSEEFRPNDTYDAVEDDQRVGAIEDFVTSKSAELLDAWWSQTQRSGELREGPEYDLFVDIAYQLAPKHPDKPLLPVLHYDGRWWKQQFATRSELRGAASRHGLVLSYTRASTADETLLPDPRAPVLRLGSRHAPNVLNEVVGQKLRFIDATPAGTATRLPPRSFWEKSTRSSQVDGASFEWSGIVRGLSCHCGIYHDPTASAADDEPLAGRLDVLSATARELQQLQGVGPSLASSIILFRGHQELSKPEDLMRVPGVGPSKFEAIKGQVRVGTKQRESRTSNLVSVLVQRRQLESLDVETPLGKFRTTMSGDVIVPDPTYRFAAGGRDKILLAAHEAAARAVREACRHAQETGVPPVELVPDLRRFLLQCRTDEPRPPFDIANVLQSAPLFPTLDGTWLTFNRLESVARDRVLRWAPDGNRAGVLKLAMAELSLVEDLVDGELELQPEPAPWAEDTPRRPATTKIEIDVDAEVDIETVESRVEGDPILDTVIDLLLEARADRVDLFDDHLAANIAWTDVLDRSLCRVSAHGIVINRDHALVRAVAQHGDIGGCAFLASTVYSAINAYYREITDHDELELQSHLVRGPGA